MSTLKTNLTMLVCCMHSWFVLNGILSLFSKNRPSYSSDIEADFRDNLKVLVPALLASENLRIKQIHGSNVTGRSLLEYFKVRTHLDHEYGAKFVRKNHENYISVAIVQRKTIGVAMVVRITEILYLHFSTQGNTIYQNN